MDLIGQYQFLVVHTVRAQRLGQAHGLGEIDIVIIVPLWLDVLGFARNANGELYLLANKTGTLRGATGRF